MSLAQAEDVEAALALGARALAEAEAALPAEQAGLWYALAVAEHVRGDTEGQAVAADHCRELAEQAQEPGWISNALSIRAMARVRGGAVEPALLDLARAEIELGLCTDEGLRNWAHTGLGYCYLELRLYELAQPHFEAALEIVACPLPLPESRTIDLMNLAEMHLRWADELERACPYEGADEEAARHRAVGHDHARAALVEAERVGPAGMVASCRATELCSRPRDEAEQSMPELRAAMDSPDNLDHSGGRATVGAALARALWRLGRRDEALATAQEAARHSGVAGDWQVGANVQWLLVEMEAESGNPGGVAGRDYGRLLSGVLWNQRLSTLQGARAALQVELLHRDKLDAERAASEDALTGVGNRRALDDALRAAAATEAVEDELHTSLLLVDLDDFKAVNDTHGHVVGDEVLRAVAAAVRSVARSGDLVARLGGDEFVVLARDTDATAGARLAARITDAVDSLVVETPTGGVRLGVSVGVATTGPGVVVGDLLGAADVAMYGDKARPR
jgi:diguanylate cyclase (GGDEF)-like protein